MKKTIFSLIVGASVLLFASCKHKPQTPLYFRELGTGKIYTVMVDSDENKYFNGTVLTLETHYYSSGPRTIIFQGKGAFNESARGVDTLVPARIRSYGHVDYTRAVLIKGGRERELKGDVFEGIKSPTGRVQRLPGEEE